MSQIDDIQRDLDKKILKVVAKVDIEEINQLADFLYAERKKLQRLYNNVERSMREYRHEIWRQSAREAKQEVIDRIRNNIYELANNQPHGQKNLLSIDYLLEILDQLEKEL